MELTVRENIIIYGRYFGLPRKAARRARRRAARLRRAHRARERQGRAALRRDEAPADHRALARQRAGGPPARRADDGARPAGAARRLGPPLPAEAAGCDAAPDDALHGRGRAALRPPRGHGPGKIVAEGSPRDLIERYSTREVVELRFDDGSRPDDLGYWTDGLVERVESLPGPGPAVHGRRRRGFAWRCTSAGSSPRASWSGGARSRTSSCT